MIANVNGNNIYYEKSGAGKPLILLHGNGETHKIFDKAVKILSESFTVYALDTRGHGNSDKVNIYHYSDIKEDIRCFIETLELQRPILYGFSDGGIVGLLLAAEYPQLLSQLIVSGANSVPGGIRKGWLTIFKIIYLLTKDPKIKMMLEEPDITSDMLRKIEIPTAVLAGSRDIIKKEHTEYIAGMIKNSSLMILPGEGHGSYIVDSEKIARLLLEKIIV